MLFIFNIIITIYSFNLFQNLSFKSSDIKVYKNIYSINLAKNTELTDLYVLTERTCFNKCDLLLEKDITREEFFLKFPNAKEVPQIVINNKHIGGLKEVENWLAFNTENDF